VTILDWFRRRSRSQLVIKERVLPRIVSRPLPSIRKLPKVRTRQLPTILTDTGSPRIISVKQPEAPRFPPLPKEIDDMIRRGELERWS
jgi:hypothetical protein